MRLLLDTHVFLWVVSDHPSLKPATRRLIASAEKVFVSSASIWEIAIKSSLGKIDADPKLLVAAIGDSGFVELPVTATHAARVPDLPHHHADPFDRLLIAQALSEPLRLLSADALVLRYGDIVTPA
ncbi:MAG: hypothetical protein RIS35_1325 [Pseudomonadota bacterium]|jgi:PIN domain nuclease of toxin-antitoxin system